MLTWSASQVTVIISEAFTGLAYQSEAESGVFKGVGVESPKSVKAVQEGRHCARIHADYGTADPLQQALGSSG